MRFLCDNLRVQKLIFEYKLRHLMAGTGICFISNAVKNQPVDQFQNFEGVA